MRGAGTGWRRATRAGTRPSRMGNCWVGVISAAAANCASTVGVIGYTARSAVVASSAFTVEAMPAPAVAIAPAAPRAHAQEDAVVKVPRSVIAVRSARVGRITVVAVGTDWLHADFNHNLCFGRRRNGQAYDQCCCTEKSFY